MNDHEYLDNDLNENLRDRLVATCKGAAAAIPLAGGMLAEVIGSVIPEQRADRIVAYLSGLSARVDEMDESIKSNISSSPEKIDLLEEGGYQAARATSSTRIQQVVEAVTNGILAEDAEIVRRKRLLTLFGELDDDEVSLLNAYGRSYGTADREAFAGVHRPEPAHLQSSPEIIDENQLFELGKDHLVRLGLLKKVYGRTKKGEVPEFDSSKGDFRHRVEISYLGRMLLKEIGMITPFDSQS